MTTKLQHSINPLTRAPHNIFAVNPFIFHHSYQESQLGLHIVVSPMDRTSESMRKMILMQEQVFKQQVQELHRLYNRQKKLMHEIENGLTRRIRPTETGQSFQVFSSRDDQKAPSSSNSGESSKMPIKFDLEMPAENAPSSSHPFEEQKDLKKMDEETDVEVELTLSIGRCTSKKDRKATSTCITATHGYKILINRTRFKSLVQPQLKQIKKEKNMVSLAQLSTVQVSVKKIRGRIG